MTHYATAPEDRIAIHHRLIYGLGAFVNNLLAISISSMVIVLNLGLGMNPALVGLLLALPRITDAVTDPLMGFISDRTKSRWGRRRPYIFVGAIIAGILFALLWQLPPGKSEAWYFAYFLSVSLLFYLAYTVFATPWVALGYELTPDYHERTRLMGYQNIVGSSAYLGAAYFLAIMYNKNLFDNEVEGAAGLAMIIGAIVIFIGVMPAIFLRERMQAVVETESAERDETRVDRLKALVGQGDATEKEQVFYRAFVGPEADFYARKWAPGEARVAPNFNWSAFFCTEFWLAYRKLWVPLTVVVTILLVTAAYSPDTLLGVGVARLGGSLVLGFFGNSLYRARTAKTVEAVRNSEPSAEQAIEELAARGGTVVARWPVIEDFFSGFATTFRFTQFRKLCGATFLVFNSFILIAGFQPYVIIYYIFGGDKDQAAPFVGHAAFVQSLSGLAAIALVTWMATKIGKRRAFFVSTGIAVAGYCLKWFCYTPDNPWLVLIPAPLMAFALAGLFTLMGSMIADVVDADELETHERREGMYGSIFWWVVKLGQAAAFAGGGFLLNATGFDVALDSNQSAQTITLMRLFDAFIPAMAAAVAIWIIATYKITEEKAHENRQTLEARRGT